MHQQISFEVYHLEPKAEYGEVILYYKGAFNQTILAHISQKIRSRYQDLPKTLSKLNSVFIELAQNIAYHSSESNLLGSRLYDRGVGAVLLQENGHAVGLSAANIAHCEDAKIILERCDQINQLDHDELRELKKRLRATPVSDSAKKGGNIGLVQIALKSRSTLDVQVGNLNKSQTFLMISTSIKKIN